MNACLRGVGGGSVVVYCTTSGITDMTLSSVTCLGEGRNFMEVFQQHHVVCVCRCACASHDDFQMTQISSGSLGVYTTNSEPLVHVVFVNINSMHISFWGQSEALMSH